MGPINAFGCWRPNDTSLPNVLFNTTVSELRGVDVFAFLPQEIPIVSAGAETDVFVIENHYGQTEIISEHLPGSIRRDVINQDNLVRQFTIL